MNKNLFIYVLLILIFAVSSYSAYYVVNYYDLYANDPLVYGAKSYNLQRCTCLTSDGGELSFNQQEVTKVMRYNKPDVMVLNFSIE
jgi:hypothetical protein